MQFRAQSSRARSARVLSGQNYVETPTGRHLSDIDPNLFAYGVSTRFRPLSTRALCALELHALNHADTS